jgi:hypothetical protein
VLIDALGARLEDVAGRVSRLAGGNGAGGLPGDDGPWCDVYELYHRAMAEIENREFVINSLGYRGYGVNRDLLDALTALKRRYQDLEASFAKGFRPEASPFLQLHGRGEPFDLGDYFRVMSSETPWDVNAAIFQKMFYATGSSSMTIMKGSTGLHNGRSCHELKLLANRNFVETGRKVFAALPSFTDIGVDLLKKVHLALSRDLDDHAGAFREIDFPDRNGVTFEFDNFGREVSDLAIVLDETARSFPSLDKFLYNLARSYYMFIGIHPFWDANGRTGKCFLNFLLMKKGLPPVVLDDEDEVLALPRYGGSMEDMHRYLKRRLMRATAPYFPERRMMASFGLMDKRTGNAAFDSSFHFRQIDGHPPRIEVSFEAHVCDDAGLLTVLADQCRIVLPREGLLHGMTNYCGFCDGPFAEWRYAFSLTGGGAAVTELPAEIGDAETFDVGFIVDVPWQVRDGDYFSCSVAIPGEGLIFNNKGLNYSYRLKW